MVTLQIWAGYADWHMHGESPNPARALSILNNARQVSQVSLLPLIRIFEL